MTRHDVEDLLHRAAHTVAGVEASDSMFVDNAPALWVNGKEIAHFDTPDTIDIRLSRQVISSRRVELRADDRVERRSGSDWITFRYTTPDDEADLLKAIEWAAAAHRAGAGTLPQPPPTGPDLARRRRFH